MGDYTETDRPVRPVRMLGNADVRRHNLSAVLRAVHDAGACSRPALVKVTGLTKTAISGLVSELIDGGLLIEEECAQQRVGRPSPPLRMAQERFGAAVLDIGVTHLTTTVSDLAGQLLSQESDPFDASTYDLADKIDLVASRAAHAIDVAQGGDVRLAGIVLAVHGITDPDRGTVSRGPTRGGELRLAEEVRHRISDDSHPIIVENDSNLAALAELEYFQRHGVTTLVSLSGELSVGAGTVIDGHLYRGSHGHAGVFSHVLINPAGPACACGRAGCWNTLIGLRHVVREALPDLASGLERIPGYAPAAVTALAAAAQAGDERAVAALSRAGAWLGEGAANIVNMLDPGAIVIGAYVPALRAWIMPAAWDTLRKGAIRPLEPEQVLLVSQLDTMPYHSKAVDLERTRVVGGGLHCLRARVIDDPAAHTRG